MQTNCIHVSATCEPDPFKKVWFMGLVDLCKKTHSNAFVFHNLITILPTAMESFCSEVLKEERDKKKLGRTSRRKFKVGGTGVGGGAEGEKREEASRSEGPWKKRRRGRGKGRR